MKERACKICGNTDGNKIHAAREMLFGYREEFKYIECSKCGCLQIKDIPENLSKYYPGNYCSYKKRLRLNVFKDNFLIGFLKRRRTGNYLGDYNIIGSLASRIYRVPGFLTGIKKARLNIDSEILDVGCGSGRFLLKLQREGFRNLTGIDPFIEADISYKNVNIYKKDMKDMERQFDFVVLSHSFEHMPQPLSALRELHRIVKPGRYVLIRIPIASSFAWKKYGVNWVGLDAPRHLFLHTVESMRLLAEEAGFEIKDIVFESSEFQFWGSEQYLRDVPLMDGKSYYVNKKESAFSEEDIKAFKIRASELNKQGDGDQAGFFLYKP